MRHISCAVFMLQIKKRERERESCQSLLEMKVLNLSTHLLSRHSQSPAHLPWGSGKWRPNKAQSEKTLPCFHLNPFDVSASGDLDIISCPSSKRHQTRCWIQNQITEPSWAKTWCVYWLNVAYILLLVCICENYFKIENCNEYYVYRISFLTRSTKVLLKKKKKPSHIITLLLLKWKGVHSDNVYSLG